MLVLPGGGPDYAAIGGLQPVVQVVAEAPPVLLPPLVEIEGETVVAYPDLWQWLALADCEWRAGWHERTTGNGFYGRHQWVLSTWRSLAVTEGYAYPDEAPIAVQLDAARENLARSGWGQWPGCRAKLGF
jgi:hypothetical protein